MFHRLRHMRISLAAKCQIFFGAAVIVIISAALYVPWKRIEGLMAEQNLQTAQGLARQATLEHVAKESHAGGATRPSEEPAVSDVPGFVFPKLIPIDPAPTMQLEAWDRRALRDFAENSDLEHLPATYRVKNAERYRLAMPLYNESSCVACHASGLEGSPPLTATQPATRPARAELLGIVVVDIPSQVNANALFYNRAYILLAGLIAGTLAIGVFYFITMRVILQPVRVLQEAAERVSKGDLNIRSDISTGDEFQQLSETFNTMLANLKTSDEQLRSINKALDLKMGQLAESNIALYESNRLKSQFLANVSHELRTPLNSILGFAELLKENVPDGADAKPARYLQNILTSGRNLLDLINDLLDLAKIEAGRMDVRSEPLSLGDVFEGLIGLLKPLAESKNLSIVPEVVAGVPIIHTDPAKLQQVLYNFLSNAIKFSPVGGKVELIAEPEGEGHVRIIVRDQGPGIPEDKQGEIFEKFRQIDASVTRQHSGTGLGLAIAKELTILLGGEIGVDSRPGEGALFWILLPLQTQAGQRDVREKPLS